MQQPASVSEPWPVETENSCRGPCERPAGEGVLRHYDDTPCDKLRRRRTSSLQLRAIGRNYYAPWGLVFVPPIL